MSVFIIGKRPLLNLRIVTNHRVLAYSKIIDRNENMGSFSNGGNTPKNEQKFKFLKGVVNP